MLRNIIFAAVVLGLFGCSYSVDAQTSATRYAEEACPDGDAVAVGWNDGEGERTGWHPVPLPTLCYYRATGHSCAGRPEKLDDVREHARKRYVPNAYTGEIPADDDFLCADDELVRVHPVNGDTCPASHALLAEDTRAPWRACTYHIDYEAPHAPVGCIGFADPLQ